MLKKYVIDEKTLHELYVMQNLSLKVIGQQFGVTKGVIRRLVDEYGLRRKRETLTQEVLTRLYETEGKSTPQIANEYHCCAPYVQKLMRRYGIVLRQTTNQARIEPDRDLLYDLYWVQWLSYEEVADRIGVDFSTIPHWLMKFDIPKRKNWDTRRGPEWKGVDLDTVVHLYESDELGTQTIGDIFGVSKSHIAKLLKAANISLRQSGYPNVSHYTAKDGHRVKSGLEVQVDNWLYEHGIDHIYEPQINSTPYFADFLVEDIYVEIWGIEGNERYQCKKQKKLDAYQRLNAKLLSVHRSDFPDLNALTVLLAE